MIRKRIHPPRFCAAHLFLSALIVLPFCLGQAQAERVLPDIYVQPKNYDKSVRPLLALDPLPDAPVVDAAAPEKKEETVLPTKLGNSENTPQESSTFSDRDSPSNVSPTFKAQGGVVGGDTSFVPPPLSDNSLQNVVRSEAEKAFYDQRRRKIQDTFERAYEGLVPLGPNEIRDVMGRYERTQRSALPPATGQPRGQVRIKTISLEPGSEPPTINVASGYVTTITIVDATGQPWPIIDMGIGGNFEVNKTQAGEGGNHVVRIMPLTRFGYGNLSVVLQDLPTPIIFKLAAGGATVDYRFDSRIPRLGPNAKVSLIQTSSLQAGSALIMTFLDNAPPPDAKRMKISGADPRTSAWLVNDRMYVRTPLTMLSPSWEASVSSADGTTVYELGETPSLLMSDSGNLIRARIVPQEEE